jgi:hypothetical protein
MAQLRKDDRTALLPTPDRVGKPAVLRIVEAALADRDPPAARGRRAAGVHAEHRLEEREGKCFEAQARTVRSKWGRVGSLAVRCRTVLAVRGSARRC